MYCLVNKGQKSVKSNNVKKAFFKLIFYQLIRPFGRHTVPPPDISQILFMKRKLIFDVHEEGRKHQRSKFLQNSSKSKKNINI
jgi:hypothetical protein